MDVDISPSDGVKGLPPERRGDLLDLQRSGTSLLPRFIKAEANLLRLPLFALGTKGLRTLNGIECNGTITRNGETHQFTLRATRNADTPYPGPLARKAHLAFLSIATEGGFPITNPITWSWRDLCRRMNSEYSGQAVRQMKGAIESTAGLLIKSHYALYAKPDNRMIRNQEEVLHLYERAAFVGSELPDGSTADTNYLWLASWYIDNLNAMFTAPLDYELWRWLDQKSTIASRLYEFLLLNFYSGTPILRIGYEKLAQFLPVKPERYRSQARQQFEPAFKLLALADIIDAVDWADCKAGVATLHIHRGKKLASSQDRSQLALQFSDEEFTGAIEVRELRNIKPPEWELVAEFYRLWDESPFAHRPTKKEMELARQMIGQYGQKKAKDVLTRVVKHLKKQWPDAKTFGAVQKYLTEAAADYDRDQRRIEREQAEQLKRQKEREDEVRRKEEEARIEARWRPVWETMSEGERESLRTAVIGSNHILRSMPRLAERFCLAELDRRQSGRTDQATTPEAKTQTETPAP